MNRLLHIGLVVTLGLGACRSSHPSAQAKTGVDIPFESVATGSYSGISAAYDKVIRDEAGWAAFWTELGSNQFPPPELPKIDFQARIVLVSLMGTQSGGGYKVSVSAVTQVGSGIQVDLLNTHPGTGCMTTDALTQPYCIVSIPRTESAVSFVPTVLTQSCK